MPRRCGNCCRMLLLRKRSFKGMMSGLTTTAGLGGDELTKHRRSLPALTGIRFFAAFYVVLFHSLPWVLKHYALPQPVQTFLGNGYLAVALFFLLSGFILAYTYEGQIEGNAQRLRFWQARFARIYPVYFLSLVLAYYFQRGLPVTSRVAVLAMVQAWNPWRPGLAGAWNYPAWSLSVEAFFYLVFPFVLPWMSRRSSRVLALMLTVFLAACVFLRTPVQGLGDWGGSPHSSVVPLPVMRLPEFLVGMILGLCLLRQRPSSERHGHPIRVAVAAAAAVVLLSVEIGSWVSLVILPFAILVYELAARRNWLARMLSTKTMVLLGGASYSIYVLQYPANSWVRVIFSMLPGSVPALGPPLTPLILIGFSILVYLFWEEPSRRALRRWFLPTQVSAPPPQSAEH
jgi:peptidoglycan/LPS O-acetylase OafA/YrhL